MPERVASFVEATILSPGDRRTTIVRAVTLAAKEAGFTPMPPIKVPKKVANAFPPGQFHIGEVDGQKAILFLGDEGHYMVACRTKEASLGSVRRDHATAVRMAFGWNPSNTGATLPGMGDCSPYVILLAQWVRGEIK